MLHEAPQNPAENAASSADRAWNRLGLLTAIGVSNPPETLWPDNPGPGPNFVTSREFYFRRVEDIRSAMVDSGLSDMKVWITEFGWATKNTTPGYGYGNRISYQMQADWIVQAFRMGRRDYNPWVGAMFLWQLNFAVPWKYNGNELHEQASFGILNGDYSPRPSYLAIQRYLSELQVQGQ